MTWAFYKLLTVKIPVHRISQQTSAQLCWGSLSRGPVMGENVFRSLVEELVLWAVQRKRETRVDPALLPPWSRVWRMQWWLQNEAAKIAVERGQEGRVWDCAEARRGHRWRGAGPTECLGHRAMGNPQQSGRERKTWHHENHLSLPKVKQVWDGDSGFGGLHLLKVRGLIGKRENTAGPFGALYTLHAVYFGASTSSWTLV